MRMTIAVQIVLTIIAGLVFPVLFIGLFIWWGSSRMGHRTVNIGLAVLMICCTWASNGPEFLGFYRPADLRHIFYDIWVLCQYLFWPLAIYREFVPWPRQRQAEAELAAAHKQPTTV
jgi:hypothetical protein